MIVLVWFSLSNIKSTEGQDRFDFIVSVWNSANKPLLILSGLLLMISHVIRAERWKLLLDPLGHPLKFLDGFLSVMVGYFVNLVIPRGGEISRCYNLYRLNQTPVAKSIGTVVAERAVDVIFLASFIGIAFLIELETLTYFFSTFEYSGNESGAGSRKGLVYAALGLSLIVIAVLFWLFMVRRRYAHRKLYIRIKHIFLEIKQGLWVVFRLKNKSAFFVYSASIWLLYYLMSYTVIIAFPETSDLGLLATVTIFAIGGIAMALPLPGGTGSYHVLVPAGLILLYGLAEDKATAFTFIFHGWQTLLVIIFGAVSLLISLLRKKPVDAKNK